MRPSHASGGRKLCFALALLWLAICLGLVPATSYAAVGDLDTSFGQNGRAVLDQPRSYDGGARDVTTDSKGRIVTVGGGWCGWGSTLMIVRFTAAGAPDPSFDEDGQWSGNNCAG
jgi:hypothetical protein